MKFASIYKNGKPDYFFIALGDEKEFQFVRPYYITTSLERPRHGRIKEVNNLLNANNIYVVYGKGVHWYGYSFSADIYGELINIILKLYKNDLTKNELEELRDINTHKNTIVLSDGLLSHLSELNQKAFDLKFKNL